MKKNKMVWGNDANGEAIVAEEEVPSLNKPSISAHDNHIFYYKNVDQDTIADLNGKIFSTRSSLTKNVLDMGLPGMIIPIHLHIHSYGGEVLAGLAGSGIISQNYVHTHRTITAQSFILIHQLSAGFWGKHAEIEDWQKNMNRFMEVITHLYSQRTKLPKTKLQGILKHDLWFTAKEALEYGLVDEII